MFTVELIIKKVGNILNFTVMSLFSEVTPDKSEIQVAASDNEKTRGRTLSGGLLQRRTGTTSFMTLCWWVCH